VLTKRPSKWIQANIALIIGDSRGGDARGDSGEGWCPGTSKGTSTLQAPPPNDSIGFDTLHHHCSNDSFSISSGLVSDIYSKLLCCPRPCLKMRSSFLVFSLFSIQRLASSLRRIACLSPPPLSSALCFPKFYMYFPDLHKCLLMSFHDSSQHLSDCMLSKIEHRERSYSGSHTPASSVRCAY
jgi:hypothetical protein